MNRDAAARRGRIPIAVVKRKITLIDSIQSPRGRTPLHRRGGDDAVLLDEGDACIASEHLRRSMRQPDGKTSSGAVDATDAAAKLARGLAGDRMGIVIAEQSHQVRARDRLPYSTHWIGALTIDEGRRQADRHQRERRDREQRRSRRSIDAARPHVSVP
jgi:hypothetical protein